MNAPTDPQRILVLGVVVCLVAIAGLVVSRRTPVPYQVLLAIGGIGLAIVPGVERYSISPEMILLVFVPGLVFEAAVNLDVAQLRGTFGAVGLLATFGVLITVAILTAGTHSLLGLPWTDAAIVGAILAPTDPIACVGLLRRIHAPARLTAMLEAESLVNDGTGVAVFTAVLLSVHAGAPTAADVLVRFLVLGAGGIAVGLLTGGVATAILRLLADPREELLATVALAYGSYVAAELAHVSGIMAVVAAGLVVRTVGRAIPLHSPEMLTFWDGLAFLMNAVLFVLIGTAFRLSELVAVAGLAAAAYAILLAARAVSVYGLLGIADLRRRRYPWSWRHFVQVGGIRGALSVALALSVVGRAGVGERVAAIAYGAVLASLVVQGGSLPLAARVLGLAPRPE